MTLQVSLGEFNGKHITRAVQQERLFTSSLTGTVTTMDILMMHLLLILTKHLILCYYYVNNSYCSFLQRI